MKTYWLSFVDGARPLGQQFLGVAIVQVRKADAVAARAHLPPQAKPGSEWVAAAIRRAWLLGCNPGGEMAVTELPAEALPPPEWMHRLLSRGEIAELERVMASQRPV
jgi:hypothetical protein